MLRSTKLSLAAPLVVALALGGCESLTVPDFNNPGIETLTENPTRSVVIAAAHGLLLDARSGISGRAGYVSALGILGRESYNFDASDPRFVTEMLIGPLDGGTPAFGGAQWIPRYTGYRDAQNVLNGLDALSEGEMSTAEKAGIRGFARTMQALDLLLVINTRDDNGAVIAVTDDPTGEPAPIVTKAEVFTKIAQLLDDASSDLQSAGSAFASDIRFPSGFTGFKTPATFRQFNRALRSRVAVYMGATDPAQYTAALNTFLPASFISTTASLSTGVYYNFGTGAGETGNGLFEPSNLVLLAHPSIRADAQLQAGGARDQRYLNKVKTVASVGDQASQGIASDLAYTIYGSTNAPISIIKNEELILLRAEANLGAGNVDAALTDINFIRQNAGGLTAIPLLTWQGWSAAQRLDELLYNKRYSLFFEGGHRWIDWRRYGKLAELLVGEPAAFTVAQRYPFPTQECDARTPPPTQGC